MCAFSTRRVGKLSLLAHMSFVCLANAASCGAAVCSVLRMQSYRHNQSADGLHESRFVFHCHEPGRVMGSAPLKVRISVSKLHICEQHGLIRLAARRRGCLTYACFVSALQSGGGAPGVLSLRATRKSTKHLPSSCLRPP